MLKKAFVTLGVAGVVFFSGSKGGIASNLAKENLSDALFEKRKNVEVNFFVDYAPYYFKWNEKGGVTEKGWLHALEIGTNIKSNTNPLLPYFEPKFKIYTGDVKYEGKTWEEDPLNTRTNYSGWNLEFKTGYTLYFSKNTNMNIYAGAGYEYWKRSLENTETSLGYSEKWSQYYLKLGVKPEYKTGNLSLYSDLYIKYPWDIKNKVSLLDVEVKPDNKLNYGIEVGGKLHKVFNKNINMFISGFFEKEKFGKSKEKFSQVVEDYVYQPESERKTYGLRLGLEF